MKYHLITYGWPYELENRSFVRNCSNTLLWLISFQALCLISPNVSYAKHPLMRLPWFSADTKVDKTDLPKELVLKQVNGLLIVKNTGHIPLYLLWYPQLSGGPAADIGTEKSAFVEKFGAGPIYKLVDSKVYFCRRSGEDSTCAEPLQSDTIYFDELNEKIKEAMHFNVCAPSESMQTPSPVFFANQAVYGDHFITVKGEATFSRNAGFKAQMSHKFCK